MSSNVQPKRHRAAIVYHYFAHYREPIVRVLCGQPPPLPEITIVSGRRSNLPALNTIDPALAKIPVAEGGLRWRLVRNLWLGRYVLWQTGMVRLALSREFDTIIYLGNRAFISTWISVVLARLSGKRTLMWGHAFRSDRKGLMGLVNVWFQKLGRRLLMYGNRARQIALTKGFRDEDLYVVFNSLDYESQKELREQVTGDDMAAVRAKFDCPDRPLMIATGRLEPRKRLDLLVAAARHLADEGMDINVLIIGDGASREPLLAQAQEMGIADRVRAPGACHDEKLLCAMFSAADLAIIPGAIGLTVMHSLAYGTPVITHDNPDGHGPEFEAILPGKTGQFFAEGSAEDLARTIADWLNRPDDRQAAAATCFRLMDRYYNPAFQQMIINAAVEGVPATELPRGESPYVNGMPR